MTVPPATRLRTKDGRAPRVAVLVYNDAQNDSRVLKESRSIIRAGADVTIFAISNIAAGRLPGHTVISGIHTLRMVQFSGERMLPPFLLEPLRKILLKEQPGKPVGDEIAARSSAPGTELAAHSLSRTTPTEPAEKIGPVASSQVGAKIGPARAIVEDLMRRAFATVKPAVWWADVIVALIKHGPDVIHANDANSLVPAIIAAKVTGAQIVYDSHELWRHRNVRQDRWLAPAMDALVESIGIRLADGVVTVSPSIVRWLRDTYGLKNDPVLVRNIPVFSESPTPDRGQLRSLAGLGPESSVIAYGGRITTSRGLEETFAALTHLPENVHLVMLGYGEDYYLQHLWALADKLGIRHRVHQVGPVAPHEVSDALADGDVAVVHVRPTCLSYRFALPNKLFESIRGGLPIAAADLPDIREVVESLGVGRMFDGDEPQDLARTVQEVIAHGDKYRAAALRAAEDLTWEQEADKLIELYNHVLTS